MIEVKESVSTWPQLASDVALGGAMVANAVRRIALGSFTASGRFYADLDELTADGRQAPLRPPPIAEGAPVLPPPVSLPPPGVGAPTAEELRYLVACATSAPSGGNMQPWRFAADTDAIRAWIDPSRSSLLDFRHRAAYLALGAALEAALTGARALGFHAEAVAGEDPAWELKLTRGPARDESATDVLWERCCNRRTGGSPPLPREELTALAEAGAPLDVTPLAAPLAELGAALGALDRVRFLSERLRSDLIGELRFSAAEAQATGDGIDVASLELDAADRAAIDVLRTGHGLGFLAAEDRGWGLVNAARDAFSGAGGALVLRATATDPAALVESGRGLMRLWLEATRRELAIHPWGSPFLFQRLFEDAGSLEDWERAELTRATQAFAGVASLAPERPILLILRVSRSAPPSVRSLRRPLDDVLAFA
jgi:nitroreductase